ncbi:MAG: BrnT family toxin [Acidobacteriota bacterium]
MIFKDVIGIFDEPSALTILDDRFDYGEIRFVTFGLLKNVLVSIIHTEDDETIRIISVRKAEKDEEIEYYKQIAN